MADWKDMCSSPARAPKSQLAVEQPLTGGWCNPPKKDIPCLKTKKKLQRDGRRDAIMIKSNPIPAGWVSWGSNKGTGDPQAIWPWRLAGFDYKPSTVLGETKTLVLEGTNKILCIPRSRGKEQWPHRRLNQNYLLVLEGVLWRHGLAGAHHRVGTMVATVWDGLPWCKPFWRSPLTVL